MKVVLTAILLLSATSSFASGASPNQLGSVLWQHQPKVTVSQKHNLTIVYGGEDISLRPILSHSQESV
jgi:hypothetical protein